MATFVSQNPDTSCKETLNKSVQSPQSNASSFRRDVLWSSVCVEDVESDCQADNITSYIVQASHGRSFVAMLWDCISNIID